MSRSSYNSFSKRLASAGLAAAVLASPAQAAVSAGVVGLGAVALATSASAAEATVASASTTMSPASGATIVPNDTVKFSTTVNLSDGAVSGDTVTVKAPSGFSNYSGVGDGAPVTTPDGTVIGTATALNDTFTVTLNDAVNTLEGVKFTLDYTAQQTFGAWWPAAPNVQVPMTVTVNGEAHSAGTLAMDYVVRSGYNQQGAFIGAQSDTAKADMGVAFWTPVVLDPAEIGVEHTITVQLDPETASKLSWDPKNPKPAPDYYRKGDNVSAWEYEAKPLDPNHVTESYISGENPLKFRLISIDKDTAVYGWTPTAVDQAMVVPRVNLPYADLSLDAVANRDSGPYTVSITFDNGIGGSVVATAENTYPWSDIVGDGTQIPPTVAVPDLTVWTNQPILIDPDGDEVNVPGLTS